MSVTCPTCGASSTASAVCSTCGSDLEAPADATGAWKPSTDDPAATTAVADHGADAARRLTTTHFGRFELLAELGSGAFGSVFKATDASLDRVVALKVPNASRLENAANRERFIREARSAARLSHPNIVPVYEVGEHDGLPYLVSEFIDGPSLAATLAARSPTFPEAARITAALADGLHYAHELGVVHRDVKPANVLIDPKGTPRLTDFGLARREATDATLTTEGQVLGTPSYMSPEQARGEAHRADRRTDVYALGAMLYQMLTGEVPFRGNARMVLLQVLTDDPRPPRGLNDRVPRDLETIALKCLEKDPARRYPTAKELADDLRRFLNNEPIAARPPTAWDRAKKFTRRNRTLVLGTTATVVALLLGVAGTTYGMVQARDEARRANEAATRAENAEREQRVELGRTRAAAARLASQRGQWRTALDHYRGAIELGAKNEIELRLGMLECRNALYDFPMYREELAALAARPDLGSHRGMVRLYQGLIQFSSSDESADPMALFREALAAGLPPAEERFVRAVLSPTLPDMIDQLREAVRLDPFHVRAHDLLTLTLLLSGRLEETREALTRYELLAPNAVNATLYRIIERAVSGDLPAAQRICDESRAVLGEDGHTLFRSMANLAHTLTREEAFWEPNFALQSQLMSEFTALAPRMSALLKEERLAASLGAFNMVRLGLFRTLAKLPLFQSANPGDAILFLARPGAMKAVLADVKRVFPIGFLDYAEGQILQGEGKLAEAEAAYRKALVTPSVLPATRRTRLVLLGVLEANALRASPAERNQRFAELRETLRDVFRHGPYPVIYTDVLIRFAIENDETGLALAWAEEWVRRAPADPKAHDALRRVEESLGAWGRVRMNLNRQIAVRPTDPDLLNGRTRAEIVLRNYGAAAVRAWESLQKNPGDEEAVAVLRNLHRAVEFQVATLPYVREKLRLWECVHLAQMGRHHCAAAALAEFPEPALPEAAVAAASVFARCSVAVAVDESLPPEERVALARGYLARAIELLKQADGGGYFASGERRSFIQTDIDLVPALTAPECPATIRLPPRPHKP